MNTPTHLAHQPIIAMDDYAPHDGIYKNATDVVSLSVGTAQYDGGEISTKVFRHVAGRWSRQSEELPLHRVFDLGTVILKSVLESAGHPQPDSVLGVTVIKPGKKAEVVAYYKRNRAELLPKMRELKTMLDYFLNEECKL